MAGIAREKRNSSSSVLVNGSSMVPWNARASLRIGSLDCFKICSSGAYAFERFTLDHCTENMRIVVFRQSKSSKVDR
jgi:hypothetical protein